MIHNQAYNPPAILCKRVANEKVFNCLLYLTTAKNALIILQVHIYSSKQTSGTEPILQEKPKKNSVFVLTGTPPKPSERWVNLTMSTQLCIGLS